MSRKGKKGGNEIVRLGMILFCVTFTVALCLGVTNALTKDQIAAAREQATIDAMKLVQTTADSFVPAESSFENPVVLSVNEAKKGGEVIGWCVKVAPKGFADAIQMMVGINRDNSVTGVSIISISETPGLGAKANDQFFLNQYATKKGPLNVVKGAATGENDILALTGATITSKAVTSGVQAALDCVNKLNTEGASK